MSFLVAILCGSGETPKLIWGQGDPCDEEGEAHTELLRDDFHMKGVTVARAHRVRRRKIKREKFAETTECYAVSERLTRRVACGVACGVMFLVHVALSHNAQMRSWNA